MDRNKPKESEGNGFVRIEIKPLSVNECWQGKRFKTPAYKAYEKELTLKLPVRLDFKPPIKLEMLVGVNALSDIDNVLKPFIDIIQAKYKFNDRDIVRIEIEKETVKKGFEYLQFRIIPNYK